MSTNYDILSRVLKRIPIGDTFDYTNVNCHIIKVDENWVDFWIGTPTHQIPAKVQSMMDVAQNEGYKVTRTYGKSPEQILKELYPDPPKPPGKKRTPPKKRKLDRSQRGLGSYFKKE